MPRSKACPRSTKWAVGNTSCTVPRRRPASRRRPRKLSAAPMWPSRCRSGNRTRPDAAGFASRSLVCSSRRMRIFVSLERWVAVGLIVAGAAGPLHAVQRDERVFAAAEKFRPDGVALLERLVNIDSGTGHAPGLEQVAAVVAEELNRLGARVELLSAAP